MALLAHIEPVDSFIITEISEGILFLVTTVGTLQTLKKPLSVATRAQKPPCPTLPIQKSKIRSAATNWTVLTLPALLVYQAKQGFRLADQKRPKNGMDYGF